MTGTDKFITCVSWSVSEMDGYGSVCTDASLRTTLRRSAQEMHEDGDLDFFILSFHVHIREEQSIGFYFW